MRSEKRFNSPPEHLMSRRRAMAVLAAGAVVPLGACKGQSSSTTGEELHFMSLEDVAHRIASCDISPVNLTQHMLDRIVKVDRTLKSYATVINDRALADAKAAEEEIRAGKYRGPLHGVPVAVKDLCYTRGIRTMGGTLVLRDFIPDVDGTVVSRLREAGAVLLGKLNLTEGALLGYNPAFDVPRNPWNRDRWPGASSSGSGVAVAAGLCFSAIGTDTGGSIRFPSSANGVVGLKPTYGRVSRFGVLPLAESLDHVGPMARRVADVAIMFDAIAGHDPRDPTSLDATLPSTFKDLGHGVQGVRIGLDRDYALRGIDSGLAAALEEAFRVLTGLGARIVDVRMPELNGMVDAWVALCSSEAVAAHAANYPSRANEYGPFFRNHLDAGAHLTPKQVADARTTRAAIADQFAAILDSVDAMACPAGGDPAWAVTDALQVGPSQTLLEAFSAALPRSADFTMPMDIAGTPAICLPSGFSRDGLPYSIQFAGRRLSEAMLCRIAYAYEQATSWHMRHPSVDA